MARLVDERRDEPGRLGAGEDLEPGAGRRRRGAAGELVAAGEIEGRHPVRQQVVVANDPVGGRPEIAGRVRLVALAVGEDHDDQRPARCLHLDPRLAPVIQERIMELLEQGSAPLGIGARGVETDHVVTRDEEIEAGGKLREDPLPLLARRRSGRWRVDRAPRADFVSLEKLEALVIELEEHRTVGRLDDDRPLERPFPPVGADDHRHPLGRSGILPGYRGSRGHPGAGAPRRSHEATQDQPQAHGGDSVHGDFRSWREGDPPAPPCDQFAGRRGRPTGLPSPPRP